MQNTIFFLCFFLFFSCGPQKLQATNIIEIAPGKHLVILDSLEASPHIIQDVKEGFFDKVRQLELEIQLKKRFPETSTRPEQIAEYREMLQKDLVSFTDSDKEMLQDIFKEAAALCKNFTPTLFPDSLFLIKTRSAYYGESTYYTRENCIIIPANELEVPNKQDLFRVMMHELFHVFSRYELDYRKELYGLIGFEPAEELQFPPHLKEKLLYNPDGLDYAWKIQLGPSDKWAVPLIISNQDQFNPMQKEFFNYLDFALFELDEAGTVICKEDGRSTLGTSVMGAYFAKIQDNTNYIIHPDEIMADNFTYLVLAEKDPETLERFSKGGQELLAQMKQVLTR